MFHESLQIAQRHGDVLTAAHAQLDLALLARRNGDARDAARLHGIADAIHEELGTAASGLEARLREADIPTLRGAVGNAAFDAAHSEGRPPQQIPGPLASDSPAPR